MAATTPLMQLRGTRTGQVYGLSLYFAGGDAINYIVPCTFNGVASATSPTDFVVPEPCRVEYISGPATGTITIDADGMPTPVNINTAVVIAQASKAGMTYANLGGGKRYRLRVTIAMAA